MIDFKHYEQVTADTDTVDAFRMEAFKELDLEDNVENNELFQKACNYGYSGGFEEMFEHLRSLVGIMRDTQNDF